MLVLVLTYLIIINNFLPFVSFRGLRNLSISARKYSFKMFALRLKSACCVLKPVTPQFFTFFSVSWVWSRHGEDELWVTVGTGRHSVAIIVGVNNVHFAFCVSHIFIFIGSLLSTQEAKVALGYCLVPLLSCFRALRPPMCIHNSIDPC